MELAIALTLFTVGFLILIKSSHVLIRGSVSVARIFNLSNWFVGVAIVGLGTSVPEFSITLASAFDHHTIGLSALIGSSTFHILGILGLCALVAPVAFKTTWRNYLIINILAVMGAAAVIMLPVGYGESVTRFEGVLLFACFVGWLVYVLGQEEEQHDSADEEILTVFTAMVLILIGVAGVFLGGMWVERGAVALAATFGVSASLVGLTLVAIGASLPELIVSFEAARRHNAAIAIGNVVGSNVFNFLGILGLAAIVHPVVATASFGADLVIAFFASVLLLVSLYVGKRLEIGRVEGAVFLLSYIAYLAFIFIRG